MTYNVFGGTLNLTLSIDDEHVTFVPSTCSQRLYVIKLLRMPESKLRDTLACI